MSGVSLKLTIDGKDLKEPFPFSLTSLTNPPEVLEVKPNSIVGAQLIGDFCVGKDPFFELSAGLDPDVPFLSRSIGLKSGLLDNPKNNRLLFQQVFGHSELTLRYWDDFGGNENKSRVVWKIRVKGQVPKTKKALNDILRDYLLTNSNGQFLLDAFRGQLKEHFNLLFISGFTCEDDPLLHLEYLKRLINSSFLRHLDGVIRCPHMDYRQFWGFCRASGIRRMSNRNVAIVRMRGSDIVVSERMVLPSFLCKSNNVISTFLLKLVNRLADIEKSLTSRINALSHDYKAEKGRIANEHKKKPNAFLTPYVIPRAESDKDILLSYINDCQTMSAQLKKYLNHPVFAYSDSRQEIVFDVPFFEFSRTEDYQYLYRIIREYETTSFYWFGDSSRLYRLPSFCYSDNGQENYWIRKYSMMYEYWCYLRIHETLTELGFVTDNRPSCAIMQLSVFENGNMRICLYHDVRRETKYRPPAKSKIPCPIPPQGKKQTPDVALVFEHTKTHKLGLLILDAKSDPNRKDHMRECWSYLDTQIVGKQNADLVFVQTWIVFSGEDFEQHHPKKYVDMPPCPSETEYDNLDEDIKAYAPSLTWDSGHFRATFVTDDESTMPHKFIGYLQTHIKRPEDLVETDHFKEFLFAQIELMEQCLT